MTDIFDSHAHYADEKFDADRDLLLQKWLPEAGIKYIMLAGIQIPDCQKSAQLAADYDYIYYSAGLHPSYLDSRPPDWETQLCQLLTSPKCKALGEIGLDYHTGNENRDLQKKLFIRQLEIAQEYDLPVILHIRDAIGDAIEILKNYHPRGVMHCYNGSADTAQELLHIPDLYFSFAGVITYKNARKPLEAVSVIPSDRVMIETDSPWLAPEPFRHQRTDSRMILRTAQKAAEIRNESVQDFISQCCENACRLFRI